uniref:Uncharacterized protein n=1 Tax=Trichuris muris TaxID=70415 RepID=A0A5S6QUJ7_TRIMR
MTSELIATEHPKRIVFVNWLPHAFCLLIAGLFLLIALSVCTFGKKPGKKKKEKLSPSKSSSPARDEMDLAKPEIHSSIGSTEESRPRGLEYCTYNLGDLLEKKARKPADGCMETAVAIESKKASMENAVDGPQSPMMTALQGFTTTGSCSMRTAIGSVHTSYREKPSSDMATAAESSLATAAGNLSTAAQSKVHTNVKERSVKKRFKETYMKQRFQSR